MKPLKMNVDLVKYGWFSVLPPFRFWSHFRHKSIRPFAFFGGDNLAFCVQATALDVTFGYGIYLGTHLIALGSVGRGYPFFLFMGRVFDSPYHFIGGTPYALLEHPFGPKNFGSLSCAYYLFWHHPRVGLFGLFFDGFPTEIAWATAAVFYHRYWIGAITHRSNRIAAQQYFEQLFWGVKTR